MFMNILLLTMKITFYKVAAIYCPPSLFSGPPPITPLPMIHSELSDPDLSPGEEPLAKGVRHSLLTQWP